MLTEHGYAQTRYARLKQVRTAEVKPLLVIAAGLALLM